MKKELPSAPTPPAQIMWPSECEELCKTAEQFQQAVNELWKAENPDELQDGDTAMSEEEARELHSERWKALESVVYYMRKRMSVPPATTPPAQEDEPVAWMYTSRVNTSDSQADGIDFDCTSIHQNKEFAEKSTGHIPLYTRPDNDRLRKAAKQYMKSCDHGNADERRRDLEKLRDALEGKS